MEQRVFPCCATENGTEGPFLSHFLTTTEGNNLREKGDCQIKDESKDNRAIVDNNTTQSLTGEDTDEMPSQGATGDEIVEALIANSATFGKKTSFSQAKEAKEICTQSTFEAFFFMKALAN
ncbi:hypothetical protein F0562_036092 [Nyssa sinensis]|uniref:tRNA (adenine(58)-N(1))-methyltransferase non-catalytic subunit TRM6 n=1 Tax=Nyssa sinensis TaxID=561372 RepID=A0A5J5AH02_9ASTE|nr:hypothetical protein F0562_036092 [Nyssa sinensis]